MCSTLPKEETSGWLSPLSGASLLEAFMCIRKSDFKYITSNNTFGLTELFSQATRKNVKYYPINCLISLWVGWEACIIIIRGL